jgi:hypothetical protein
MIYGLRGLSFATVLRQFLGKFHWERDLSSARFCWAHRLKMTSSSLKTMRGSRLGASGLLLQGDLPRRKSSEAISDPVPANQPRPARAHPWRRDARRALYTTRHAAIRAETAARIRAANMMPPPDGSTRNCFSKVSPGKLIVLPLTSLSGARSGTFMSRKPAAPGSCPGYPPIQLARLAAVSGPERRVDGLQALRVRRRFGPRAEGIKPCQPIP